MVSVGLVISVVGLWEKVFKTAELKVIGPSLVGGGVLFTVLRILICTVPACCGSCIQGEGKHNMLRRF